MSSFGAQKSEFLVAKAGAWKPKALLSMLTWVHAFWGWRARAGTPAELCQVSSEWLACKRCVRDQKSGSGPKQADRLESVNFEVKLLNNGVAITVSQ